MRTNNMVTVLFTVVLSMSVAFSAQAKGKSVGSTSTTDLIQQAQAGESAAMTELNRRMSLPKGNALALTPSQKLEVLKLSEEFVASKKPAAKPAPTSRTTVQVSSTLLTLESALANFEVPSEVTRLKGEVVASLNDIKSKAPGTTKLSASGAVEGAISGGQPDVKGYAVDFSPQSLSVALTGVNEGFQAFAGATGNSSSKYTPQVLCDAAFALGVERARGAVAGDAVNADSDILNAVGNGGVIMVAGIPSGTIEQFAQNADQKAKACRK